MKSPRASHLLTEALPHVAAGMVEQARLRDTIGQPKRIDESILKAETKRAIAALAADAGLAAERYERTIKPDDWPRVGRVDIVVSSVAATAARPGPASAFVELKWGFKDALWNCIWDVAKSALVSRLGLADEALVLAGFSDAREWEHVKYGSLLTTREWDTAAFQRAYRSEWRYWARPPRPPEKRRTGPYRLPERFRTTLVARHAFRFEGDPWSLGLVEVAAVGDRWVELDDWAQPI